MLFLLSVLVYLIPLLYSNNDEAVLDEMYLIDSQRPNRDVQGTSSLAELLQNDFWGRPIHTESSHKSWRPVSVLLLRYLSNDGEQALLRWINMKPILLQRLINLTIHSATAILVGLLACKVFPSDNVWIRQSTRCIASLIFALHPTHVEAVVNVANRPHILSLLCSLLTVYSNRVEVIAPVWTLGLMSCETLVFQLPAVLLMSLLVKWREGQGHNETSSLMVEIIPRYVTWIGLTAIYLIVRYLWGTLTIPTALLERAEAPFHELQGMQRILSFSYIGAIHFGKSFGIDLVGFAHEYSYVCIDPIRSLSDFRLLAPLLILAMVACLHVEMMERRSVRFALLILTALAWMATLFPILGFLNVGTFVADRLIVPSTVVVSCFGGHAIAVQIVNSKVNRQVKILLTAWFLFGFWAPRVWQRTRDWTEHSLLFERTRKTCPNSAKNLLQLSKVHSGSAGAQHIDLAKSLDLVQQAHEVDPDFCRVHFQFAHVYLQQQKYQSVEYHLTRAVHCPSSASQALELWNRYWKAQLDQEAGLKRREKLLKAYEKETSGSMTSSASRSQLLKSKRSQMSGEL